MYTRIDMYVYIGQHTIHKYSSHTYIYTETYIDIYTYIYIGQHTL